MDVFHDVGLKKCVDQSNPKLITAPQSLLYVIYTSGSTGIPKGVAVQHASCINVFAAIISKIELTSRDRWLSITKYTFDISVLEFFGSLLSGVVCKLSNNSKDKKLLWEEIRIFKPTIIQTTPSALENIWDISLATFKDMKLLLGGEKVPTSLCNNLLTYTAKTYIVYGPTETTVWSSSCEVENLNYYSIGKPLINTNCLILSKFLQLQPIGITSELCISGAGLARGYLNRPLLTSERFIENPFATAEDKAQGKHLKLYKTGDLVRWLSDGNLEYIGRIDDQIKLRGYRIELGEVENALSRCEGISRAVVVIYQRDKDDEGTKQLVGYYVRQAGSSLTEAEITNFLKKSLPDYMVPSLLVELAEIPLTANGKVDKRALPLPDFANLSVVQERPVGKTEETLAGIWSDVLSIDADIIYRASHFFALGGHSLKATQVLGKIHRQISESCNLKSLFEHPVLKELGAYLDSLAADTMPAIVPVKRKKYHVASYAEQRLWFLDRYEEGRSLTYLISGGVLLQGQLNVIALRAALNYLVKRHEVLRTVFVEKEGMVYQRLLAADAITLQVHRETLKGSQEKIHELLRIPFDLEQGPLFECHYFIIDTHQSCVCVKLHHIISDGWSFNLLIKEFEEVYLQLVAGGTPNLVRLPVQYIDYSAWQKTWLNEGELQKQINYWQQQLEGMQPLQLPTDFPRPSILLPVGKTKHFSLGQELSERLQVLADQQRCTLFMVLYAGLLILLNRYSQQEDLVVGSPISGRRHPDLQHVQGLFVNTLALRQRVDVTSRVGLFLQQVRETCLAAYDHQDIPFEKLVELLDVERDTSRHPVFQVMLVLQNQAEGIQGDRLFSLQASGIEIETAIAKFDFDLAVAPTEKGLIASLTYNTQLYRDDTIERLCGHLLRVYEQLLAEREIRSIEILSSEERKILLEDWNRTDRDFPSDKTVQELFEAQVARTPNAIALVFEDQEMTYRTLNEKANQLAHSLRARYQSRMNYALQADTLIGLCVERGFEMIIGILGIIKAGAAYVPIDPEYPKERIDYILRDSATKLLVTHTPVLAKHLWLKKVKEFDVMDVLSSKLAINCMPASNPDLINGPLDLVYAIYTSGSTGRAKGVLVAHRNLVNYCTWALKFFDEKSVPTTKNGSLLLNVTITFDGAITAIYPPLLVGSQLFLSNFSMLDERFNSQWEKARNFQILKATPSHLRGLNVKVNKDLSNMFHNLVVGGEPVQSSIIRPWLRHVPNIYIQYGPTEATVGCSYYKVKKEDCRQSRILPIGKGLANTRLYVVDNSFRLTAIGMIGELCISGVGLSRGYLNHMDLMAEKFFDNPFLSKDDVLSQSYLKVYKTGDLVRWLPDGNLEYIGRMDDQIKLRGYRIELGEVENVLSRCPGILQAVVVIYQRDREDDSTTQLVGYYIRAKQTTLREIDIKFYLKKYLPEYMIPSLLVEVNEILLTSNGKVDKRALPNPIHYLEKEEYTLPQSEEAKKLAKIWSAVLSVPINKIFEESNFFKLGGDSLNSLQVVAGLKKYYCTLAVQDIFAFPSLRDQAKKISSSRASKGKIKKKLYHNNYLIPLTYEAGNKHEHIICIHDGLGGIVPYFSMLEKISPEYGVFGVEYTLKHRKLSFLKLVESYAENIILNSCNKKINLLGYSLGGLLAFEVAKYLDAKGIKNYTLTMVDVFPYVEFKKISFSKDGYVYMRKDAEKYFGRKLDASERDFVDNIFDNQKYLYRAICGYRTYGCVQKSLILSVRKNKKSLICGKWENYISEIEHAYVKGSHKTIFSEKNVGSVVKAMMSYVKSVPAREST